jgi:hypothetical protein
VQPGDEMVCSMVVQTLARRSAGSCRANAEMPIFGFDQDALSVRVGVKIGPGVVSELPPKVDIK